ncbi:sarcinarray family MAST domain-containing protein [Methanosarcina sp.]|uniref:sarcinarray family MAST domain-containing protein n=1 Tax=Methanosarcina sp. TaxID=2213 RepID=UPI003C74532A
MKAGVIILGLLLLSLVDTVSASSPYGSIDVYYNDKILPGDEVAKPVLKIGEPFKIKITMTLNQTSRLFIEVDSIGSESPYEVIEGPSKFAEKKHFESLDRGVYNFEWILRPTEGWADWSMPVNFWYQIHEEGEDEPAVKGEFTVAYPYISNEYYEGEAQVSENQLISGQPASENSSAPAASAPAFSLLTAIVALAFVFFRLSRH